ncbi:MAG: glycosyltransferase family 4 protein [Pseudomonadota bacterium]
MPDSLPRPIIAIVSKQRLTGATNGSSAYLLAIARSLTEAGFELHLIQPSPTIAGRSPIVRLSRDMEVFARHAVRGARRIGSRLVFANGPVLRGAVRGVVARGARKMGLTGPTWQDRPAPYSVATPWQAADHAFLREQLAPGTQAIIADYMFCHPAFEAASQGTASAIVMHDLFHAREGGDKDSVALVSREEEVAMLARADSVFAIQQNECDFLARCVPGVEARLVPMPAEPVAAAQPGRSDRVLMVGSNTAPNIEGLRTFLTDAWPTILAAKPTARLQVAGTMNSAFIGEAFPNVDFLGMVDDLAPLYAQAGVVISPLTFGSGLKIKLIEGLAQGKAMVVSSVTLQGVEDVCREAVIRADEGEETAQAIITLLDDPEARSKLATKALMTAQESFSAQAVHGDLRRWAEQLRG